MSGYRVDVALPGGTCDAPIHRDEPVSAVVRTIDDSTWCGVHWWPLADELKRDGVRLDYSPSAWARLD